MDLQNLRERFAGAVEVSRLSQAKFSAHHGLSYSTVNKFLKGHLVNPRLSTIEAFEQAISATHRQ